MYQLENDFHKVYAQYLETEFCDLWLVLCRWVTYGILLWTAVKAEVHFGSLIEIQLVKETWPWWVIMLNPTPWIQKIWTGHSHQKQPRSQHFRKSLILQHLIGMKWLAICSYKSLNEINSLQTCQHCEMGNRKKFFYPGKKILNSIKSR